MTKFVAIVSAKGGVGKTTAAINISSALDWWRRDVIALDANFANPDVGIHLGTELLERNIHSALKGKHHISESIYRHPSGLRIIPGNISYEEARKAKRENLTNIILDLVGSAEVVILDTTPGLGEDAVSVIKAVDYVIIITTPDIASVSNSLKMVKLTEEYGKQILGIMVNRTTGHESELHIKNIETMLRNRVIGIIPEDPLIMESVLNKNPIIVLHPNSPSSIGFKKIAAELIGEKYVDELEEKEDDSVFKLAMKAFGIGK